MFTIYSIHRSSRVRVSAALLAAQRGHWRQTRCRHRFSLKTWETFDFFLLRKHVFKAEVVRHWNVTGQGSGQNLTKSKDITVNDTQVQKLKYHSQCQVSLLQFEVYKENTFLLYFFKPEHNSFIFPEFTLLVPVKQECNEWQLQQLHCHPENDYCKG